MSPSVRDLLYIVTVGGLDISTESNISIDDLVGWRGVGGRDQTTLLYWFETTDMERGVNPNGPG